MQDPVNFSWEVVCERNKFESQKSEPPFQAVVALSRAINALRFSSYALIGVENDDSPAGMRQRINSFLYSCALLFEAFDFVGKKRDVLKQYSKFTATLGVLLDDKEVAKLLKKIKQLRNRGVFHFDASFIQHRISAESDGWCQFGQGRGQSTGESYYDLSDRALLEALVGGPAQEFNKRYQELLQETTKLLFKFINGADELIENALLDNGWIVREVDSDPNASTQHSE